MTSGARGEPRLLLGDTRLRQWSFALLGELRQHLADAMALLAAIEDEPPWLQPAVVGDTRGDADQGADLGVRRTGFLQFGNRRGTARGQEVEDRGCHGKILLCVWLSGPCKGFRAAWLADGIR